jgi:hypothetical protein
MDHGRCGGSCGGNLRAGADGYGCGTVHILLCTVPHPPPRPVPDQRAGQILTGGGNNPRSSLIVASMVKRRRRSAHAAGWYLLCP